MVGTAGAAMRFATFFSVVGRGDAVPSFTRFSWFARGDSERGGFDTCFCGVVLVGCCPTAPDVELRGVEATGAGSGEGVYTGVSVCTGCAEALADGSGSGVGACTAVVLGR